MLVNLSNHPSSHWPDEQLFAAQELYGHIVDMEFPYVDPTWSSNEVDSLAEDYFQRFQSSIPRHAGFAVHIMGEMTFCFALIQKLKAVGIACVASTTHRNVIEHPDGSRTANFEFVRFRQY